MEAAVRVDGSIVGFGIFVRSERLALGRGGLRGESVSWGGCWEECQRGLLDHGRSVRLVDVLGGPMGGFCDGLIRLPEGGTNGGTVIGWVCGKGCRRGLAGGGALAFRGGLIEGGLGNNLHHRLITNCSTWAVCLLPCLLLYHTAIKRQMNRKTISFHVLFSVKPLDHSRRSCFVLRQVKPSHRCRASLRFAAAGIWPQEMLL